MYVYRLETLKLYFTPCCHLRYACYVCRYFEIWETLFRLFLTGFLVLVVPGTVLQILIGLLATAVYMKICTHFEPFINETIGTLKEITHWQILLVLELTLLLRTHVVRESRSWISVLAVFGIFASVVFDISRALFEYLLQRLRHHNEQSIRSSVISSRQNSSRKDSAVSNPIVTENLEMGTYLHENYLPDDRKSIQLSDKYLR